MIVLYIILGILGAFLLLLVFPVFLISNVIYTILLVRTNKKKWSRTVSWDDEEQKQMFAEGAKWGKDNEQYRKSLEIKNGRKH